MTDQQKKPRHLTFRHVALGLTFCAAVSLAACSSNSPAAVAPKKGANPTSGRAKGGGSETIVISNFMFSPMKTTVAPGATVTVTNKDSVDHTLTSKSGGFGTGDIPGGQSKTFTAPAKAGSYSYICTIHQYMTGTLVVS